MTTPKEDEEITGRWYVTKSLKIDTGKDSKLKLADLKIVGNVLYGKMVMLRLGGSSIVCIIL